MTRIDLPTALTVLTAMEFAGAAFVAVPVRGAQEHQCGAFIGRVVPPLSPMATAGPAQYASPSRATGRRRGAAASSISAPLVQRGGASCGGLAALPAVLSGITHAQASAVAKRLYPLSTFPILAQTYLMTREEAVCPRGVAVGLMAQTASVLLAVPIVATVRSLRPGVPFIEMDWIHWIEAALLHASMQATAMSFRQAVRASEEGKPLPRSATRYAPMAKVVTSLFLLVGLVGLGHMWKGGNSWDQISFLNNALEPPTPGKIAALKDELSFPVWISHWSMVFDFLAQLWYMWKWGNCTENEQWKVLAGLHLPYCIVNAAVILNHLHRDQVATLRLLHPVFVFIGSLALMVGAYGVVRANGWSLFGGTTPSAFSERTDILRVDKAASLPESAAYPDWDLAYTAKSLAVGAVLSYASLYLTV